MSDPRGYMVILADAGGPEPDKRLLKLLRVIGKYGLTVCNVQGSHPPEPGTLEAIEREHGVRYDDTAHAERLEALEWGAIRAYLSKWEMKPAEIDATIERCLADPALRQRFLNLALAETS